MLTSISLVTVSEVHHRSSGSNSKQRSHHTSITTLVSPRNAAHNTQSNSNGDAAYSSNTQQQQQSVTHVHHHHKSKSKSVGATATVTTNEHSHTTALHSNGVHSSQTTPRLSTGADTLLQTSRDSGIVSANSNKLTPITSTINHDNGIILKVVYKMHSKRMKLLKVTHVYDSTPSVATSVDNMLSLSFS
jgi:hypothetical protein